MLRDLAESEGISVSQVSRALRRQPGVAPEVRERLLRRAYEMNYRNCSSHHTNKIALLYDSINNFTSLLPILEKEIKARKWNMVLISSDNYEILSELFIDGIFFLGYNKLSRKLPDIIKNFPVVAINDYPDALEGISSILPDADGESELVLEHLFSLGHRRIARIRQTSLDEPRRWANRGLSHFYETAERLGIRDTVINRRYQQDSLDSCIAELIAAGITAIIDVTHEPAQLLHVLRKQGKRVPDEISVITYEDFRQSCWEFPPLTTLAFDLDAIADQAVRLMARKLCRKDSESIVIPTKLIIRESTGRCPEES